MRLLPKNLVIHRWCPKADAMKLLPIGESRDGKHIHLARPETVEAFGKMAAESRREGIGLQVIWAYRSPMLQEEQFTDAEHRYGKGQGIKWLAPPGFSEHQTGWVLDIGDEADPKADDNPLFEKTRAFSWLSRHASRYGFELSFKPGNWQGVSYEPWHWRFVGTEEARQAFHPAGSRALTVWGKSVGEAVRRWLL